jgi:hypothetical protein
MKQKRLSRFVTIWSVLGSIAILALLLAIWGLVLRNLAQVQAAPVEPTPIFNLIPAPTSTLPVTATIPPTPTVKPDPNAISTPSANDQIKIGDYVQISGTGGDGLRVRSDAGIQNPPLFLGMEAEVFQVKDGPKNADGFIWWSLVAPYDENRKGWAASNYLTVIAKKP